MPPADDDAARVRVVGLGADGWAGLPEASRQAIAAASVVVGGARHLALLPDIAGQRRVPWPTPFDVAVVEENPGCVVVASGDPLVSGVATTLVDQLGAHRVEVLPALSSVALARARMRWSAEDSHVISAVGRDAHAVLRELAPGRRLLVLSADEHTPGAVARLLADAGYAASRLTLLGDLGAASESYATTTAEQWQGPAPRLHVLAVELSGPPVGSWAAGLPDGAYEHDGQLTKRDLRASALSRLAPQPGQLLWDVGAGAGSIGIEWLRSHPGCRAVALERDPERAERAERNARRLGVPALEVRRGTAPDGLAGLPTPDAVFVGGGATEPGVLPTCLERLAPGGRLVVHGVTLETEQLLATAYAAHGGELTRHQVETAAPIGGFTGWTPARAVTQWAWTKPLITLGESR